MITVKKVKANGREHTLYPFGDNEYSDIAVRLQAEFATQGKFYEQEFGVSQRDAELAGWEPERAEFGSSWWMGWNKFLKDNGKLSIDVSIETVHVREIIFPNEK